VDVIKNDKVNFYLKLLVFSEAVKTSVLCKGTCSY